MSERAIDRFLDAHITPLDYPEAGADLELLEQRIRAEEREASAKIAASHAKGHPYGIHAALSIEKEIRARGGGQ